MLYYECIRALTLYMIKVCFKPDSLYVLLFVGTSRGLSLPDPITCAAISGKQNSWLFRELVAVQRPFMAYSLCSDSTQISCHSASAGRVYRLENKACIWQSFSGLIDSVRSVYILYSFGWTINFLVLGHDSFIRSKSIIVSTVLVDEKRHLESKVGSQFQIIWNGFAFNNNPKTKAS